MSQGTIMKFLTKNPKKWFTTREISEKIGTGKGCCARSLTKLIKQKEVISRYERKNLVYYKLQ